MQAAPVPKGSFCESYWEHRAVETERKLLSVENGDLRAVYVELIGHYRRMASLVDAPIARGAALQCRRESGPRYIFLPHGRA